MLYSRGVSMESLGIPTVDGTPVEADPRKIWQRFAEHYYLFRGTPTGAWFDHELHDLFGVRVRLNGETASARLRPDRRAARVARVPSARAVRAIPDRGAGDDRPGERLARCAPRHSRIRLGRSSHSDLPTRRRVPHRDAGLARRAGRAREGVGTGDHRFLIVRRRARRSVGRSSSRSAPRRPTMAFSSRTPLG